MLRRSAQSALAGKASYVVMSTSTALALSLLVVRGVAGLRPDWTYGAVAAVAVALAPEANAVDTAGARALAIGLGAATGVLLSLPAWPDRAEARFERHFKKAMQATAARLDDALEAATEEGREAAPPDHVSDYHKALQQVQEALEILMFVGAYHVLPNWMEMGQLQGIDVSWTGLIYFSGINFTTLGYTQIEAAGPIRLINMTQSLGGFMILTWSATFSYSVWKRALEGL